VCCVKQASLATSSNKELISSRLSSNICPLEHFADESQDMRVVSARLFPLDVTQQQTEALSVCNTNNYHPPVRNFICKQCAKNKGT
jgi:phosphoribosyl-dephospho-CoA transferase